MSEKLDFPEKLSFVKQITSFYKTEILCSWKITPEIKFTKNDISDLPITSFPFQSSLIYENDISDN